jgi:hypothetical protein
MINLRKLFAKLGCCRTLCSFLRGQVVNYSQHLLTMLLSKLTQAQLSICRVSRKFSLWGSVQPPTVDRHASAWFCILSMLQAKPRCPLDGSAP